MYNITFEGNSTIGQILEIFRVNTAGNVSNIDSTDSTLNVTFSAGNITSQHYVYVPRYSLPVFSVICIVLGCMVLATIIGNVFVISAIILEKSLQGVSNYLILSLAVTDLMVAVLVMPLSLINQVSVFWYLGSDLCDMWISFDVLCCTASILHLVAISLDRYWAVSNIDYIRRRCAKQIITMIIIVWVVSISISIAPLFGWKEPGNDPNLHGRCTISQDLGYTVFSTVGAFYCPLCLMLLLNWKIYKAARYRIRKKRFSGIASRPSAGPSLTNADGTTRNNSSGSEISQDGVTYNGTCVPMIDYDITQTDCNGESTPTRPMMHGNYLAVPNPGSNVYVVNKQLNPQANDNNNHKRVRNKDKEKLRKEKLEMKRERKAARVLGIIMGAFVACWLPFFILAILGPFCGSLCNITSDVYSVFLWLGYFNSLINPVIYTIFNPSFRNAFRKLILKKYRMQHR